VPIFNDNFFGRCLYGWFNDRLLWAIFMITYRAIRKTEQQTALNFCRENGLDLPVPFELAFGAWDDDILIGICVLKKTYQIEPLINTSAYGVVAQILAEKTMACASLISNEVVALVKDEKTAELFEKYGFVIRDKNVTYISKEI
jgi:hypothetical protein